MTIFQELDRLVAEGKLTTAQREIRRTLTKPSSEDRDLWLYLFGTYLQSVELDNAKSVVDLFGSLEPRVVPMLQSYLSLEHAYQERLSNPNQTRNGEPTPYAFALLKAASEHAAKNHAQVKLALAEAKTFQKSLKGMLFTTSGAGKTFDDICDSDDVTGKTLPCGLEGTLYDLDFSLVTDLIFYPVQKRLDLLWKPAKVILRTKAHYDVLVPALYAGSGKHSDDLIKAGRMTTWDHQHGYATAQGQRDWKVTSGVIGIHQVRSINFEGSELVM